MSSSRLELNRRQSAQPRIHACFNVNLASHRAAKALEMIDNEGEIHSRGLFVNTRIQIRVFA